MKQSIKTIIPSLLCITLLGCGGEDPICDRIDQSSYYSEDLQDGGPTQTGISSIHWSVSFNDGYIRSQSYDFVESAEYTCKNGVVTTPLNGEEPLEFKNDLRFLVFHPSSDNKLSYERAPDGNNGSHETCALVEGNTYTENAANDTNSLVAPPPSPVFFEFKSNSSDVRYSLGEQTYDGIYDCTLDKLHIHQTASSPRPLTVTAKGNSITVTTNINQITLTNNEPTTCDSDYLGVCGGVTSTEPCDTLPCPKMTHKTFDTLCDMRDAGAVELKLEECGKDEGKPVTTLSGACTLQYDPVCGKIDTGIVCVTAPCQSFEYKTFGNACSAGMSRASIVFEGECGSMSDEMATGEPPIHMASKLPESEKTTQIIKSEIINDILQVTLGYSGCDHQHFDLFGETSFMESNPVQASVKFQPLIEDECAAAFSTSFSYDLLPLKHVYQQMYQTETGTIILPNIGTYQF